MDYYNIKLVSFGLILFEKVITENKDVPRL